MNWLTSDPDFGDIFDEEIEKATKIRVRLMFSGTEKEAHSQGLIEEPNSNRQMFIIERATGTGSNERTDKHFFIVNFNVDDISIDWYHKEGFGSLDFIKSVDSQLTSNELVRILSKHWNFIQLI